MTSALRRRPRLRRLAAGAQERGEAGLRQFIISSPPARLERIIGSGPGLRFLFSGMVSRYDARAADGFTGAIRYDLKYSGGSVRSYTVSVRGDRAQAQPGALPERADLVLKVTLVDFLRIGVGDLNPLSAVLNGRLELEGDFGLAMRLGSMFGMGAKS